MQPVHPIVSAPMDMGGKDLTFWRPWCTPSNPLSPTGIAFYLSGNDEYERFAESASDLEMSLDSININHIDFSPDGQNLYFTNVITSSTANPLQSISEWDVSTGEVRGSEERSVELTTKSLVTKTTRAHTSVQDVPPP